MRALAPFLLVSVAACLRPDYVACGDQLCPASGVCVASGCASPDAVAECTDLVEGAPCALPDVTISYCIGGACRPVVCGDRILGLNEVCDDGNVGESGVSMR